MEERIRTLHPDPDKQGVRISKAKYDVVAAAVRDILRAAGPLTFTGLNEAVNARLRGSFDGSISWYTITVQLDLEARGEIGRVPGTRPPQLRLAS